MCRVVFACSCGDVVPWLQPDWVLVLSGRGQRHATLYRNPNSGAPPMAFQPRVTTTVTSADDVGSVGKKDVRSACEQAWSVKRMADLDISKSVYGSKCAKPDPLTISVVIDEATTRL